jgi:hypothetical protein
MAIIEALETIYLEADATSVTFSSISASYEHLQIRLTAKSDRDYYYDPIDLNLNSDTTSGNYQGADLYASNTSESSYSYNASYLGGIAGDGPVGGTVYTQNYSNMVWDLFDYANANKNTSWQYSMYVPVVEPVLYFAGGSWDNTAAVATIKLEPKNGTNFVRGSEFTLYGIKSS